MKISFAIVFFGLLLHGTAFAQDKTLYGIGQDMFTLVEAYSACADRDAVCTVDDALAMQATARNGLRDLALLIQSGSTRPMMITLEEARLLTERAHSVRNRLPQRELFDASCNQAVIFQNVFIMGLLNVLFKYALIFFYALVLAFPAWAPVILACAVVVFIPLVILFIAGVLLSFVVLAPCLFFWL